MKTGTMKKALSLFLAVLMIALAIPFTLLTVAATESASDVNFSGVKISAQNADGYDKPFGTGVDTVFNDVLHEDDYASAGGKGTDALAKRAYFDANGEIGFKNDGDYYGIIVTELEQITKLSTFTIWSPNSTTGGWLDNAAYDIYYSMDGVSFIAVEDASFDDAVNDAHENVPTSDFDGTATSGNSTGGIYKNEIDMKGVTAKYVAIAVRDTIPDQSDGRRQIVLYEITATGTSPDMYLESGASVRMDDPTGLRFTGLVSKSYVEGLKEEYQTEDVTLGMLITPTSYLNDVDFTKEALSGTNYDPAYLEIDAADETVKEDGDYYKIKCVIANIKNYDREFSAILYVKVDGEILAYSEYNEVFNSRSVSEVAEAAYYDLKDANDGVYTNEVTVDIAGVSTTKYSRYDTNQRKVLYGFFGQGEQENLVP